jgi:hypothetical protein
VASIKTIAQAIATLGKPDFESHLVSSQEEKDGQPPKVIATRVIRYYDLSASANVDLIERPDGTVLASLTGKLCAPGALSK